MDDDNRSSVIGRVCRWCKFNRIGAGVGIRLIASNELLCTCIYSEEGITLFKVGTWSCPASRRFGECMCILVKF